MSLSKKDYETLRQLACQHVHDCEKMIEVCFYNEILEPILADYRDEAVELRCKLDRVLQVWWDADK